MLATNRHWVYPGSGQSCTSSSGVLGALYCLHRGARRGVATSEVGEEAVSVLDWQTYQGGT
jgi:hypothetical protein